MSDSTQASPTVTDARQLVEYLAAGCKPKENWRIGTEHEKFGFTLADRAPLPYEGENGIGVLLGRLAERYGLGAG